MEYRQAVEWLQGLGRVAKNKPGPERMQRMMAALGNPQRRLRFIHIAGTNGKGSATVMVASILHQAGYKTGANIGPFVLDFRERFQINGKYAGEEAVARAITTVYDAAQGLEEQPLTFMATTAAALVLFEQEGCDLVCLEAGIGGARDDTNVIEDTLVACMMRIGFDHTELLGNSLAEIAAEKCGIFKNGCDVVCYPAQPPTAMEVIRRQAAEKGCPLVVPDVEDLRFYESLPFENRINYGGYDLALPFNGPHQALNAAVAVETALCLWRRGYQIEDEHIINGIEAATLPARIELLGRDPLFILDGAHNEDSAAALAATLQGEGLAGLVAVVGLLADKRAEAVLRTLSPYIYTIYTVTPDTPRAMSAEILAELARPLFKQVVACQSVAQAVQAAMHTPMNGVLVCGSFYLAGEAKAAYEAAKQR